MKLNTQKKQKKWKKITETGRFNLFQRTDSPTTWEVSWLKPKGHGRRRFRAESLAVALKQAPIVAGLITMQVDPVDSMTIFNAFNETLDAAKRGEKSKQDWAYWCKRFMRWLAENHSECVRWKMLTRPILRKYLATLEGNSDNTKRMAMQPLAQTSSFISREHNIPDVAQRMGTGSKLKDEPKTVYLEDVVEFIDFLAENNPRLEVGAALQGLVGLQLQEATRLTWNRVDLDRGLVEISGEVKNDFRKRVIPVCDRALEALRRAYAIAELGPQKVETINAPVVRTITGEAYGDSWRSYSLGITAALKVWNSKIDWKPKDLRNCLPTFAAMRGIQNDLWEQYIGHAPRSITARHYIPRLSSVTGGEEAELVRHMDLFRMQITGPLNQAIAGTKETEVLNIFEQGENGPLIGSNMERNINAVR